MEERKTNEKLLKKFTSQFELVKNAILLAENMIKTHRAPRVKTDTQNVALQVIEELAEGKDELLEIPQVVAVEEVIIREVKEEKPSRRDGAEWKTNKNGEERKKKVSSAAAR